MGTHSKWPLVKSLKTLDLIYHFKLWFLFTTFVKFYKSTVYPSWSGLMWCTGSHIFKMAQGLIYYILKTNEFFYTGESVRQVYLSLRLHGHWHSQRPSLDSRWRLHREILHWVWFGEQPCRFCQRQIINLLSGSLILRGPFHYLVNNKDKNWTFVKRDFVYLNCTSKDLCL